jgi:multidrug efflux system membrane fusion protein
VYVIQNNVAHMRSIKAGVTNAGLTQATGIGPGDVLADSSFDKLQDNAAVVVSNKPVPSGTSSNTTGSNNTGSNAP